MRSVRFAISVMRSSVCSIDRRLHAMLTAPQVTRATMRNIPTIKRACVISRFHSPTKRFIHFHARVCPVCSTSSLFQSPTERFISFHSAGRMATASGRAVSISYGEVYSFPHSAPLPGRPSPGVSISYGEVYSFPQLVSLPLSNCQLGGLFARTALPEPSRLGSYGCTFGPFSLKFLASLWFLTSAHLPDFCRQLRSALGRLDDDRAFLSWLFSAYALHLALTPFA